MKTVILNSINEIKDGEEYQIKHLMSDYWSTPKTYSSNMCESEKQKFEYLISRSRIRIFKID